VPILDAGGQYLVLLRKSVERQGLPAAVLALNTPRDQIENKYGAIIISGSPASSHEQAAPLPDPSIWNSHLPLLGICYGMQAMVVAHGGEVAKNAIREDGRLVGSCQLHSLDPGPPSAELQIRIGAADTRGRGVGTAATNRLLEIGFDELDLHRI